MLLFGSNLYCQTTIGNINGFRIDMTIQEVLARVNEIKSKNAEPIERQYPDGDYYEIDDDGDTTEYTIYNTNCEDFYHANLWTFYFENNRCYSIEADFPFFGNYNFTLEQFAEIQKILSDKYGKPSKIQRIKEKFLDGYKDGLLWNIKDKNSRYYQIRFIKRYSNVGKFNWCELVYLNKTNNDKFEKAENARVKRSIKEKLKSKKSKL